MVCDHSGIFSAAELKECLLTVTMWINQEKLIQCEMSQSKQDQWMLPASTHLWYLPGIFDEGNKNFNYAR